VEQVRLEITSVEQTELEYFQLKQTRVKATVEVLEFVLPRTTPTLITLVAVEVLEVLARTATM
jgi:hypothetical protein